MAGPAADVFSRKWALVVILCMIPLFLLFALRGNPARGRAAALAGGIIMTAARARWNLRRNIWFWFVLAIMVAALTPARVDENPSRRYTISL